MQGPIKILLDARKIADGGIGVYTRNLIRGLLTQPGIELTLLGESEKLSAYPWLSEVRIFEEAASPYSINELFFLGKRINKKKFDLYHTPHFVLPYGIKTPSIVTIHDLIHLSHPEKAYYPLISGALLRSALSRATRVLTVSKASFADLERLSKHDKKVVSRIRLIPNALDPSLADIEINYERILSRMQLEKNHYFLVVSSMSKPHKGVKEAIEAFQALKAERSVADQEQSKLKLVLVGKGSQQFSGKSTFDDILCCGEVTTEELVNLYAGARGLLMPSRAEGFCLPVLEAKAFGAVVVSTPVPAVLELLDDFDFVSPDFSVKSLKETMQQCLNKEYNDLRKSADAQEFDYKKFSVQELGRSVLKVYQEALYCDHNTDSESYQLEGQSI